MIILGIHDGHNATAALIQNSIIQTEQKPSMRCNIKWKKGGEPDYFAT